MVAKNYNKSHIYLKNLNNNKKNVPLYVKTLKKYRKMNHKIS